MITMIASHFIALDFEATGLNPHQGDRITEVGLVRVVDGRIVERFESLVNCETRVPHSITTYTGITQQMVDNAPPASEVMRQVADFIGTTAVVAHNASFDQSMYLRECRRQGIDMVPEPFICTMRLSRRIYPEALGNSLTQMAQHLSLPFTGRPHRALADAQMAAQLLLRMRRDLSALQPGLVVAPQLLRDLMHVPVSQVRTELKQRCA